METREIRMSDLRKNEGQVAGLPPNPRWWTDNDVELLARSIQETPELLQARTLVVFPHDNTYVIIGGNLRYDALSMLGEQTAPCTIIPEGTDVGTLVQIALKDNGTFGKWDSDELANSWDDVPFASWGIRGFDDFTPSEMPDYSGANKEVNVSEFDETMKMKLAFSEDELAFVKEQLDKVDSNRAKALLTILHYEG